MKKFLSFTLALCGIISASLTMPRTVYALDRLVYDAITGATNAGRAGSTGAGGRATIGNGFNFGNLDGVDPNNIAVNRMQFRLVTGTTAQNYSALQVRIQFYDTISLVGNDLFTDGKGIYVIPLTPSMLVDVPSGIPLASLSLGANKQYDIDLTFNTPSVLNASINGVAINFQGNQGAGFVNSTTNLSTTIRRGNAFGVGSTIFPNDLLPQPDGNPDGGYFRDVEGDHNLNFDNDGSDSFNLPFIDQFGDPTSASYDAVYMRLYADVTPVVVPETNTCTLLALGAVIPVIGLVRRRKR